MVLDVYYNYSDPLRRAKLGALVSGFLQLILGTMIITMGMMKSALLIPTFGGTAYFSGLLSLLAGSFGIQYSRTGNKCPTIASMVLSILAAISLVSGIFLNSIFNAISYNDMRRIQEDGNAVLLVTRGWTTATGVLIFAGVVNFIASIVQASFACCVQCDCCKPTNTNVYLNTVNSEA